MLAHPELEHQQAPEPVSVVGVATAMLVEEARDGVRAEPLAVRRERVACKVVQVVAKPASERHAESGLAARGHSRRQFVRERTAPRDLAFAPARLETTGKREAERDDLVVEKRRAQLERVRHRRYV